MIKLNINLGDRGYPIYITSDYDSLGKCFKTAGISGSAVIVTDTNVARCQLEECRKGLEQTGCDISEYIIEAGEKSKNLDTVKDIYGFLAGRKFERKSTVIAFGGGVVGDIAGFAAATFLRGINFVQIPTSLLAQADSSVGGKVGVDFQGGKNIIGSFYQPRLVYINVNSLVTLPKRELRSGLAEVVKHGVIRDADYFEFISGNIEKIFGFNTDTLMYLARVNCTIKGGIVEQDEKEVSGQRAVLNFGHTIGHAVESASGFELLHGECVSIGMMGAFIMARNLGMIDDTPLKKVRGTLESIGLPVGIKDLDVAKIYDLMLYDKKVRNGRLNFILPKEIGEVFQVTVDDENLVKKVLEELAG